MLGLSVRTDDGVDDGLMLSSGIDSYTKSSKSLDGSPLVLALSADDSPKVLGLWAEPVAPTESSPPGPPHLP